MRNRFCILFALTLLFPVAASAVVTPQQQRFSYYFYPALLALDDEDYDRAASLFSLCHAMDSTSAVVNYYLGATAANLERYDKAMDYFRRAADYDVVDYGYHYANELWKAGERKEAFKVMKRQLEKTNDKASTLMSLSQMYRQEGQYSKQAKTLRQLEKITGPTSELTMQWAQHYASRKQLKKAIKIIDDYLETDKNNYELPVFKADLLIWNEQLVQAEQTYLSELQLHPNNVMASLGLSNLYRYMKEYDKSEQALYSIMTQDIDYESKTELLREAREKHLINDSLYCLSLEAITLQYPSETEALISLANFYLSHQQTERALPLMERIVAMQPENVSAAVQLCYAYSALSDTARAITFSDTCITRFPNTLFFYFNSAVYRQIKAEYNKTIEIAREGLMVSKATDEAYRQRLYSLMGDAFMQLDSIQPMCIAYDMALSLNPEDVGVLNNYAYSLATHGGDLTKAERMSRHTIEKQPENPTFLDTYAWILYLRGDKTLALYYIQKARELIKRPDKELDEHYDIITSNQ